MSHGLPGEGVKAEPNLVPLLDVVMQLIMFFILGVNFVSQQVNENIALPLSQSARPRDPRDVDLLILNVNKKGHLEIYGDELTTLAQMREYLKTEAQDARRQDKERGGRGDVKKTVVLRADQAVEYKLLYDLLSLCKEKDIGFRKLQLRAMTKTGG